MKSLKTIDTPNNSPLGDGGSSGTIKVGIIGGAGYTGGELIRILLHHPHAEIVFVNSKSNAGNHLHKVHQDLYGETELLFSDDFSPLGDGGGGIDVLFLCLGHGDSKKFLSQNTVHESIRIIDLANDFRLAADAQFASRNFIYGLPELQKDKIQLARNIANPGCFATAIQLGLLPLAKAGLMQEVYTTGITGSTGAGQSFSATSHFSWRANNIQAYKTLTHQHNAEIEQSILQLQNTFSKKRIGENEVTSNNSPAQRPDLSGGDGGGSSLLNFVPWRGDFTRGIFISSQIKCAVGLDELINLYQNFYVDQPFTNISKEPIFLKQVVNTNKCMIQLEKSGNKLVVHSTIDNLLKGASGQAVQNMNLMFGLDETTGLKLKPAGF